MKEELTVAQVASLDSGTTYRCIKHMPGICYGLLERQTSSAPTAYMKAHSNDV